MLIDCSRRKLATALLVILIGHFPKRIGIGLWLGLGLSLGFEFALRLGLGFASNVGICTTTFRTNDL